MILKVKSIFIIFILLGIIIESKASTFKPFIRSRYSLRWRKTTEPARVGDSTTVSTLREEIDRSSNSPKEISEILTDNSGLLTTVKQLTKTSTHSPDYDYYNNEVEEGEHKN